MSKQINNELLLCLQCGCKPTIEYCGTFKIRVLCHGNDYGTYASVEAAIKVMNEVNFPGIKSLPVSEETAEFMKDIMIHPINDPVNHPAHYTSHPSGVECIQITRHMSFNLGNAVKYLWRSGIKDQNKEIEDLKKAVFYINDEIKRLENEGLSKTEIRNNNLSKTDPDTQTK